MTDEETRALVQELRDAVQSYNLAVRDYERTVERNQDALDSLYSDIQSSAEDLEQAREELDLKVSQLQDSLSEVEFNWDELFGDPRKIEYRDALRVLREIMNSEWDMESIQESMPSSPEFPTAETIDYETEALLGISDLIHEITKDQSGEEMLEALKARQEALIQALSTLKARNDEVSTLIMSLTAEREMLQGMMTETNALLQAVKENLS